MTRFLFLITFLTIVSISCDSSKNELVKNIQVTNSPVVGELSSLIESYEIIPLDSNPSAYIKYPAREIFTDSLILILDGDKKIVVFNKYGKFLSSISKQGRGPNEYLFINDFSYNTSDRLVSILDKDKIKRFNLKGDYINETRLGFNPSRITNLSPDLYIIEKKIPTGDSISDYYIRLVNEELTTISARLPIKPLGGPGFGTEGQNVRTIINGDHAFFFSYFADTVYHVDNNSIRPAYSFNYDKKVIAVTNGTGEYDFDPDQAYRYLSYFEFEDLNLLFYLFRNNAFCLAFNASNSITKLYNTSFIIRNVADGKGILIVDSMSLSKLIEGFDPDKTKCSNPDILDNALAQNERGGQYILKVSFMPF
jgi:hypothetical protein